LHARQLEKFSKLARDAKYPQKVVTEEQAFWFIHILRMGGCRQLGRESYWEWDILESGLIKFTLADFVSVWALPLCSCKWGEIYLTEEEQPAAMLSSKTVRPRVWRQRTSLCAHK
jgi:hypothetical protein